MSRRKARVAQDLRARLTEILRKRVSDPRLEGVPLSGVEPPPDFEKAGPFIRRCLGERLKLRRVPELEFRLDESLERAERVEEILREVEEGRAVGEQE